MIRYWLPVALRGLLVFAWTLGTGVAMAGEAAEFFRAVNLNGPAVEIDGRRWVASQEAKWLETKDRGFENHKITLVPSTDDARAQMLRSSVYHPGGQNRLTVRDVPPGSYTIFLYVWEDNNSTTYDIDIQGRTVLTSHHSGSGGQWHKLGPWTADAADGRIVITSRGGHANWSGLEIWRGKYSGISREDEEFFEARIRPVLTQTCSQCHDSKTTSGGLRVDRLAFLLAGGDSGPALVPGSPNESLLIDAVRRSETAASAMPPEQPLAAHVVADFERWISRGAPWPESSADNIRPERRVKQSDHWSFQPITDPAPPGDGDASTAIDRFVNAKLTEHHLTPLGAADRRTLIRRVTYDLIGLPPTPEETEAFVNDARPDAYAQLVDRLLESPRYGEKWGRHWLDLVRYADTAGDNSDYPVPQAYRYRDWVIRSFNEDLPYDEFLRQQIAGDLLEGGSQHERDERTIATGYLAIARRFGSLRENYPWHLTIEDTIDNVGRTMLGLTLSCSRCHDHKFDPVAQEDYYALYGIFASTRYPWPGIELDKKPVDFVSIESFGPGQLAYAVAEARPRDARVHIAGNPEKLGDEVPRGFLSVLGGEVLEGDERRSSGRKALADWLTDPKRNPLTARVMANRVWQYHFGRGLVATPSDFGLRGTLPTHPELLDWLASRFVESGWSVKSLHRLILHSAAYQRASVTEGETATQSGIDPDNHWLWRFHRRRLTAEELRDTLLLVGGKLKLDPPTEPHPFPPADKWGYTQHKPFKSWYESDHRSVYFMTRRLERHPFFATFDGPDRNVTTPVRTAATTSLQSLFFLNDPLFHDTAARFADRALQAHDAEDERIGWAFRHALGREATHDERTAAQQFLKAVKGEADEKDAERQAWQALARVILRTSEFLYID